MQSKHKQTVNITDENLTDYSFLRRYHYITKSKNYLKRRYRIPMFIETPCSIHYQTIIILSYLLMYKVTIIGTIK